MMFENYILNIYNVSFSSYSDQGQHEGRSNIIGLDSNSVEPAYVVSTQFNILADTTLLLTDKLDENLEIDESEKLLVASEAGLIIIHRCGLYMSNINMYSEYDDFNSFYYFFRFINPLYKDIYISDAEISVSGMILYGDQQAETHLEHLTVDFYKVQGGFFMDMSCYDTSIIFNSTFSVVNTTFYFSEDRLVLRWVWNPIRYLGAGKMHHLNFTSDMWCEFVYNRVISYNFFDDTCVMEENDFPVINFTNTYFTMPDSPYKNLEEVYAPFLIHSFDDRAVDGTLLHMVNLTFYNMPLYYFKAITIELGPFSDAYIDGMVFDTIFLTEHGFNVVSARNVEVNNIRFVNCTIESTGLFTSISENITVNNITMDGIYGTDETQTQALFYAEFTDTLQISSESIRDINIASFDSVFTLQSGGVGHVIFSDLYFED